MTLIKRLAGPAVLFISLWLAGHSFASSTAAEPLSAPEEYQLGIDTESVTRMERTADSYKRRGLYSYAEAIIQDVFEIRQKKKGADDPEVATTVNNLAWIYDKQGKHVKAETLYKRVIQIWATAHGIDHPDVALGFNNLGNVERALGNYAKRKHFFSSPWRFARNCSARITPMSAQH
jgi:tetratricopeptide (TPR) repeat protein